MLQSLKIISWILLLAFGQQAAWAFSLAGPIGNNPLPVTGQGGQGDAWQVPTIGYGLPGDLAAPKNLGEEYRRNAQVYYWACDANFLDFFGSNGVVAVNQTFSILNSSLTNVDAYSSGLTEFPLNSQAFNYSASALGLLDLKSEVMGAMVEQLGLVDPVRYAWTLHDRVAIPGSTLQCPFNMVYSVVQRNFDITASPLNQVQYSPYVNGTLWTYIIEEGCTGPNPLALAAPVQVDPLADGVTAVAGNSLTTGGYYISLTRDDEAGLRFLLTTNNLLFESPTTGALLLSSTGPSGSATYGPPFFLYTSNYTAFFLAAQTNSPTTLSNLYPGLAISSYSNYFTVLYTTNYVFAYYTNQNGAPYGSPQIPVYTPVVTYTPVLNYAYVFANVIVFNYSSSSTATLITTNVTYGQPGYPYTGALYTNITTQTFTIPNVPSGDFYINTNSCGTNLILSEAGYPLAQVSATTNSILVSSNSSGLFQSKTLVNYSTTYIYVAEPVVCGPAGGGGTTTTNAPGLYQGIGGIQFTNAPFDSLLGQFFQPITNNYSMHLISNSKLVNQTFQRVITAPDFLISAADLAAGSAVYPPGLSIYSRNVNFNQANVQPGLAGPGTIDPATTITLNKSGNLYLNNYPGNELLAGLPELTWGSFDGTTNDPVVYPNGTSIANLSSQVLVQINPPPPTLPNGTHGVAYSASFSITGGAFTPPYTWSLPNGGLPPGLTMSLGGVITGTPSPSDAGNTYGPFTLQLTDALSRTIQWNYSITIQ